MDANTVFKFAFSFDLWTQFINQQQQTALQFNSRRNGLLVPGAAQTYLFTDEAIPVGSVLREVSDPRGNKVFYEMGFDMDRYVTASEPVFNYQGVLNGYRQTLSRTPPVAFRGINL